ncbi:MAG: transcriptional regulator [Candidatus Melainabacteria bacterium]|jgi:transcriptional regulator, XRE family|nr:MAG: transcriptional regulator [Candidatus Melainabacteria bacterium]
MSSEVLYKFSQKLKMLRQERGLSQEGLALLCNIDRTYVGRLENLKRNPSLEILSKIADGLGMTLSELLDI